MKLGKIALAATIPALAISSVAGQAVAADRLAAPVADESQMGGDVTTLAIVFLVLALAVGLVASDSGTPASP